MDLLHSADWHILLHKKKVPYDWQVDRFKKFFSELLKLETSHHVHIIAGDVFDKKPEPDEMTLAIEYFNRVTIPTYIIPGNHEATKRGETFLEYFIRDRAINNDNVRIITKNEFVQFQDINFQFFPYGEMQLDNLPTPHNTDNTILVTHIRGEVPPHIFPEYDFEKLRPWKLILAGDLHFMHKYKDYPFFYPGSPMNVSFDRHENKEYGVLSFKIDNHLNYEPKFINLKLPKLIRKTVKTEQEVKSDSYNHVVYELVGKVDELAKIENSALIDKKIIDRPKEDSKLDLHGMSLSEELSAWLEYIKVDNKQAVIEEFNSLKFEENH